MPDRLHQEIESFLVPGKLRPVAPFIGDAEPLSLRFKEIPGAAIDIESHLQRFLIAPGSGRHDHEVLHIGPPLGMRPAPQNLDFRQGKQSAPATAEGFKQRKAQPPRRGLGRCHGDSENRVGPETGFVGSAIECHESIINAPLVADLTPSQSVGDFPSDVVHSVKHGESTETLRVAIAEFPGLILAGGGPRRDQAGAGDPVFEDDLRLHSRVATGVEDLEGADGLDFHARAEESRRWRNQSMKKASGSCAFCRRMAPAANSRTA
ncbi:MAG: hypothetical protein R3F31_02640 [Verrucomicrobiales bacterium]